MRYFFKRIIHPFQFNTCTGDETNRYKKSRRLPQFCIGHVAMVIAVGYIVIMQLLYSN